MLRYNVLTASITGLTPVRNCWRWVADMYHLLAQYFPATQLQISKHKKQNIYTLRLYRLVACQDFAFTGQKQKVEEGYMPFREHQFIIELWANTREGSRHLSSCCVVDQAVPTTLSRYWIKLPRLVSQVSYVYGPVGLWKIVCRRFIRNFGKLRSVGGIN